MAEEKNVATQAPRRRLQGTVLSDKMEKTIVVETESYRTHPVYKKRVSFRKKYKVDDPKNEAAVGDIVVIEECRPISHDKHFRLVKIVKKGE
jgi:small subunit ribosomal protein S17